MINGNNYTALLLLSILVSGYIFSVFCHRVRYICARQAGHRLYLTSAALGFLLVLITEIIVEASIILNDLLVWGIGEPMLNIPDLGAINRSLLLSGLTPLVAVIAIYVYNDKIGSKSKWIVKAWEKDDLSHQLTYATTNNKLLAVTLDNRKVFVGLVARTAEPDTEMAHITILPFFSGHRTEDDLRLELRNRYDEVFQYFVAQVSSTDDQEQDESDFQVTDFYVVIPLDRVVITHIFNTSIFERISSSDTVLGI